MQVIDWILSKVDYMQFETVNPLDMESTVWATRIEF